MNKLLSFVLISFFSVIYLMCMNSTQNRQILADQASVSYKGFSQTYRKYCPNDPEYMVARCYAAYISLVDMHANSYCFDEEIKHRLVFSRFCDLDEGILVLKGFLIEDNLNQLVCSRRFQK